MTVTPNSRAESTLLHNQNSRALAQFYGGGGWGNGRVLLFLDPRRLLRKWPFLLLFVMLGLAAAAYFIHSSERIYEASGIIELSVRRPRIMAQQAAIIEDSASALQVQEIFNTRLESFRGRSMMARGLNRLDEARPGEFSFTENGGANDLSPERREELRLRRFEKAVELSQIRRSRLIRVRFEHSDPDFAAEACNVFMAAIQSKTVEENRTVSDAAVEWLEAQATLQREELLKVENALLQFRREYHIDVLESQRRMVEEGLQTINRTLVDLESRESALRVLNTQIASLKLDQAEEEIPLPSEMPLADEIRGALERWRSAVLERNRLLVVYTPNHPEIQNRDNAIALYRQQAQEAIDRGFATSKANHRLLEEQVERLRATKEAQTRQAANLEIQIVELRTRLGALEREREAADQTFRSILARIQDARMAADETTAMVTILEPAVASLRPVRPRVLRTAAVGAFLGGLTGILFLLVRESLDDRVIGPEDFVDSGLPVLAVVPHVKAESRNELATASIRQLHSEIGEAYAGLGTLMESPRHKERSKVILIASSIPEEGKTTTSSNLASTLAQKGRKVLLVDFDLRRPRLGGIFPLPEGQVDLFSALNEGRSDFDSFPYPVADCPGLEVIASRPNLKARPAAAVGQSLVPDLIAWARDRYDHVVLDAPPLGLVSDILALAPLADLTLMMARPAVSRKLLVRHSLERLLNAGIEPAGIILNDYDLSKSSANYYSPYAHYRHYYSAYSTSEDGGASKRASKG
jgi:succinoglycan biosynthesis transport protein ExoP